MGMSLGVGGGAVDGAVSGALASINAIKLSKSYAFCVLDSVVNNEARLEWYRTYF